MSFCVANLTGGVLKVCVPNAQCGRRTRGTFKQHSRTAVSNHMSEITGRKQSVNVSELKAVRACNCREQPWRALKRDLRTISNSMCLECLEKVP